MEAMPIEIKLGDGTVVKANDMEEAFRTVAKMKEDTAAALREARDENERMAQELEEFRSQTSRLSSSTDAEESSQYAPASVARGNGTSVPPQQGNWSGGAGFDRDLYHRLLNEDPVTAQNYLDAARFGIANPADVPAAFNQLHEQVGAITQQSVAGAFLAQHYRDYHNSPENNRTMRLAMEQLCAQGFPFNLDTMNYAYTQLVNVGAVRTLDSRDGDHEDPNPPLRGSGGSYGDSDALRAETMSTPELEALLRSKGMMR